ncbi:MAG TPA: hypothetical protein VEQ38_24380 [Verrucomicrobiae bacterium]|nr:hypothetical protein [Verrucomicrobiae bacterium]
MFSIAMPESFKIGDTAAVSVNKKPATVFWRDADTLVLNDTDARRILHSYLNGDLRQFYCTDADGTPSGVKVYTDKAGYRLVVAKD